jgi:hypothetical protein
MTDRENKELEIKRQVFEAVLERVRVGHIENPSRVLVDLSKAAIELLLGDKEEKPPAKAIKGILIFED